MPRPPRSLHWRLALILLLCEFVITIIVALVVSAEVREARRRDAQTELHRLVSVLAARYETVGDDGSLHELVMTDGRGAGARITIIDADGTPLADSQFEATELESQRFGRPEVDAALRAGFSESERFSPALEAWSTFAAQRIMVPSGSMRVVRAGVPMRDVYAGVPHVGTGILAGGLLLMSATIAVVWIVVRSMRRQTDHLRADVRHLADGELGHRVMAADSAELSPVAESLNVMARELGKRFERLQLQQKEQQAILQSMSNGVIALDSAQRVMSLNRAAASLLAIKPEKAIGRLIQEVVREPELHRFIEEVLDGTSEGATELTLAGENAITVRVVAEKLTSVSGEPTGLLVVFNDITQARRFESLRSDFAANVSHELRTPITNIKGYVETLLAIGWDDREQATHFLHIIQRNGNRLAAIVEDVMALTKLEQPETDSTLERERVSVAVLLASVTRQFSRTSAEKKIRLATDVEPGLNVVVHSQLVEQAIGNLVSNAISYSPPGTTVTMTAAPCNGSVQICITDEGPGIPRQHLPRLFERFYRADKARSREMGGTGLGLAIVKHIALLHGGRAEVESEIGKGSTFRIVLPRDNDVSD